VSGICGIVFADRDTRLHVADLTPMARALDMSGRSDGRVLALGAVGLGVQDFPGRLVGIARRDVQGGVVALAFHGSLYGDAELRAIGGGPGPLERLIDRFLESGLDFVHRLRGEFALALWDGRDASLHLATDRFRVHPLFYRSEANTLVFASRMRSILACPESLKYTLDPDAIVRMVGSSIIPSPQTVFTEVRKLPPGHVLTYRNGAVKVTPYWEISFLHPDGSGEAALAERLRSSLAEAVSVRLDADAAPRRIGTFLSGGVDSSTVTGLLSRRAERPITSFSIGFDEARFDEMSYARIAARAFGVEHRELVVTPRDAFETLPLMVETFDEPFANASAIPSYFCAKLAREHGMDVVYAGDGGDELFAGNQRYASQRVFDYYHQVPGWLETVVRPVAFGLADAVGWAPFVKAKKYIRRAQIPYPERLVSYDFFRIVPPPELLEPGFLESLGRDFDPYAHVHAHYHRAPARSELDRQLYVDLKLAISDNDLFKVTRATEAAGIAVRYPFLDSRLVEFATSVPARIKMRGTNLRSFFKKAYAELLPTETRAKKKHGFGLPIPIWLREDRRLNELMHDVVLGPTSVQRGYFRRRALEDLVERHRTDQTSFYGTVLWNLMLLELWHRARP